MTQVQHPLYWRLTLWKKGYYAYSWHRKLSLTQTKVDVRQVLGQHYRMFDHTGLCKVTTILWTIASINALPNKTSAPSPSKHLLNDLYLCAETRMAALFESLNTNCRGRLTSSLTTMATPGWLHLYGKLWNANFTHTLWRLVMRITHEGLRKCWLVSSQRRKTIRSYVEVPTISWETSAISCLSRSIIEFYALW